MVVICSISMRWRNCGVNTSRCERLVVNLTDIVGESALQLPGAACGNPAWRDYNAIAHQSLVTLHPELLAKIKSSNLGIFCQVARLSGAKYFPFGHDVGAIGDAERLADIVIRDKNSNAAIPQI